MDSTINELFKTVIPKALDNSITKGFGLFKEAYIEFHNAFTEDRDKYSFLNDEKSFNKFLELPFLQKLLVVNPKAYSSLIENLYMVMVYPYNEIEEKNNPMNIVHGETAHQFSNVSYDMGSGPLTLPGYSKFRFKLEIGFLSDIMATEEYKRQGNVQYLMMNEAWKILEGITTRDLNGVSRAMGDYNYHSVSYIKPDEYIKWYDQGVGENHSVHNLTSYLDITSYFSMFETVANKIFQASGKFDDWKVKYHKLDTIEKGLKNRADVYSEYLDEITSVLVDDENVTSMISLSSDLWYTEVLKTTSLTIGKFNRKFSSVRYQEELLAHIIKDLGEISREDMSMNAMAPYINHVVPIFNSMVGSLMKPLNSKDIYHGPSSKAPYSLRLSSILADALDGFVAIETLAVDNLDVYSDDEYRAYTDNEFLKYVTDLELRSNLENIIHGREFDKSDDRFYFSKFRDVDYKYQYLLRDILKHNYLYFSRVDTVSFKDHEDKVKRSILDIILGVIIIRIVKENIGAIKTGATDKEERIVYVLNNLGMTRIHRAANRLYQIFSPKLYKDSLDNIDKKVVKLDIHNSSYIKVKPLEDFVVRGKEFKEVCDKFNNIKENLHLYDHYGIKNLYVSVVEMIERLRAISDLHQNRDELSNLAEFGMEAEEIKELIDEDNKVDYDKILFSSEESFLNSIKDEAIGYTEKTSDILNSLEISEENGFDFNTLTKLSKQIIGIEERAFITGNELSEEDITELNVIKEKLSNQFVNLANEISEEASFPLTTKYKNEITSPKTEVSKEDIEKAEKDLDLKIPKKLKKYLMKYKALNFKSVELAGLGVSKDSHINIVTLTKSARKLAEIPLTSLAIEYISKSTYIICNKDDSISIWENKKLKEKSDKNIDEFIERRIGEATKNSKKKDDKSKSTEGLDDNDISEEGLFGLHIIPKIKGMIDPKDVKKYKDDIDKAMNFEIDLAKKSNKSLNIIKLASDLDNKQQKQLKFFDTSTETHHYETININGYDCFCQMEEFGHVAAGNAGSAISMISFITLNKKNKIRLHGFLNCSSGMKVEYAVPGTIIVPKSK